MSTTGHGNGEVGVNPAEIAVYLRTVIGDQSGVFACAAKKVGGPFLQKFFTMPDQENEALQWLQKNSVQGLDVFCCPYLGERRERVAGWAKERRWVHVDIDHADPDLEALKKLRALVVASGTAGHVHAYIPVSRSLGEEGHRALCDKARRLLRGDFKIRDNDLLRPAGTLNYKAGEATRVAIVEPAGEPWTPEELSVHLTEALDRAGVHNPDSLINTRTKSPPCVSRTVSVVHDKGSTGLLRRLPEYLQRALRTGTLPGWMPSHSELYIAVCVSAVRGGWTQGQVEDLVYSSAFGPWLRKRPSSWRNAQWQRAAEMVRDSPLMASEAEALEVIEELMDAAARAPWGGRSGPRDRGVLRGLHLAALSLGSLALGMSVRHLAVITGINRDSVNKALKSLEERGWIHEVEAAHVGRARRFRLAMPNSLPQGAYAGVVGPLVHDYWINVGPWARYIFDALATPGTVNDLHAQTGVGRRTVVKHLKGLERDGLVVVDPDGRWSLRVEGAALEERLDHLAQVYGWSGTYDLRQEAIGDEWRKYREQDSAADKVQGLGVDRNGNVRFGRPFRRHLDLQ